MFYRYLHCGPVVASVPRWRTLRCGKPSLYCCCVFILYAFENFFIYDKWRWEKSTVARTHAFCIFAGCGLREWWWAVFMCVVVDINQACTFGAEYSDNGKGKHFVHILHTHTRDKRLSCIFGDTLHFTFILGMRLHAWLDLCDIFVGQWQWVWDSSRPVRPSLSIYLPSSLPTTSPTLPFPLPSCLPPLNSTTHPLPTTTPPLLSLPSTIQAA